MTPLDDLAAVIVAGAFCVTAVVRSSLRFTRWRFEEERRELLRELLREDPKYRERRAKEFAERRRILERHRAEWLRATGNTRPLAALDKALIELAKEEAES